MKTSEKIIAAVSLILAVVGAVMLTISILDTNNNKALIAGQGLIVLGQILILCMTFSRAKKRKSDRQNRT